MEPERVKKKPTKAARSNRSRVAKKGTKGAVARDEPEPAIAVIADPWLGLR